MPTFQLTDQPPFVIMREGHKNYLINPQTRHWKIYEAWLLGGNVPAPAEVLPVITKEDTLTNKLNKDVVLRAVVAVLAKKFGVTPTELIKEIKDAL